MKVRRGRTALVPSSLRQTADERGQMASTIWVDESRRRVIKRVSRSTLELVQVRPTNEAVDEVDLAVGLSDQRRGAGSFRVRAGGGATGVLSQLGGEHIGLWLLNGGTNIAHMLYVGLGSGDIAWFARLGIGRVRRDGGVVGGLRRGVGPHGGGRGKGRGG